MAIYVDDMRRTATVKGHHSQWSHLFAMPPDRKELIAFGRKIGLRDHWLQHGTITHFDVTESKRNEAIAAGAQTCSVRDSLAMFNEWKSRNDGG